MKEQYTHTAIGPWAFRFSKDSVMAAKRVGRKRGRGKGSRKPPLHIVSDFGTRNNSPIAKRYGNSKLTRSKGNYAVK